MQSQTSTLRIKLYKILPGGSEYMIGAVVPYGDGFKFNPKVFGRSPSRKVWLDPWKSIPVWASRQADRVRCSYGNIIRPTYSQYRVYDTTTPDEWNLTLDSYLCVRSDEVLPDRLAQCWPDRQVRAELVRANLPIEDD